MASTMTTTAKRPQKDGSTSNGFALSLTDANRGKLALVERILKDQFATALARGFHGVATLELAVQDGTIQHVRHGIERTER